MKLMVTDLDPHFLKRVSRLRYKHSDDINAAEGIMLRCPACHWSNNGRADTHAIIVWRPRPALWKFGGTGYADLSIMAPRAQVAIISGCRASFAIKRGKVDFC